VFFIDEIHRLNKSIEEMLYSAMEDQKLDIVLGKGPSARTLKLELNPFTVIGATTRIGMLSAPLRDRFGVLLHLDYYEYEELRDLILQKAEVLGLLLIKMLLLK
jgi:Holliday junction DNA helicase RuvB